MLNAAPGFEQIISKTKKYSGGQSAVASVMVNQGCQQMCWSKMDQTGIQVYCYYKKRIAVGNSLMS